MMTHMAMLMLMLMLMCQLSQRNVALAQGMIFVLCQYEIGIDSASRRLLMTNY
jgi:hypothetical protein